MHIAFWFNAYSIMKLFYLSSVFVQGFSGLREDFVFYYISPTILVMKTGCLEVPELSKAVKGLWPHNSQVSGHE